MSMTGMSGMGLPMRDPYQAATARQPEDVRQQEKEKVLEEARALEEEKAAKDAKALKEADAKEAKAAEEAKKAEAAEAVSKELAVQKESVGSVEIAAREDTYIPGTPHKSAGLYRVGRNEEGSPVIEFDPPTDEEEEEDSPFATDLTDREVRQLKNQWDQMQEEAREADNPREAESMKRKMAQVERELSWKDDGYHSQNAAMR